MSNTGSMTCTIHSNKKLEEKEHNKTYHCNGCFMKGKGKGYRCEECDYVLHSQCMFPSNILIPTFLQRDTFEFRKVPLPPPRSTGKRYCDACGMAVKGFVYHCNETGFDLHPCCATLDTELEIDGQRLVLRKESAPKTCDLCSSGSTTSANKIESGWFYASMNEEFKCHVFCIMNIATESLDVGTSSSTGGSAALAKLESLPLVKRKRGGKDGKKYWKILKTIVTYVLAAILGDPTTMVAKVLVEGVVQLADLL